MILHHVSECVNFLTKTHHGLLISRFCFSTITPWQPNSPTIQNARDHDPRVFKCWYIHCAILCIYNYNMLQGCSGGTMLILSLSLLVVVHHRAIGSIDYWRFRIYPSSGLYAAGHLPKQNIKKKISKSWMWHQPVQKCSLLKKKQHWDSPFGSQLLDIWKIPDLISVSSIAMATPDSLHHQYIKKSKYLFTHGIDYSEIFRTDLNNTFLFRCLFCWSTKC